MTTIRPITQRDRDAILTINAGSMPGVSALDSEDYDLLARECELFHVIEDDGRVAG